MTERGRPAEDGSEQTPAAGGGEAMQHLGQQREQHLPRSGRRALAGVRSREGAAWLE